MHQWLELDDRGAPTDDDDDDGAKTPTEDEPALPEGSAIEDREPVVRIPLPVPRASRIYTPRVGPPASPKQRELRDDTQITFQVENPKQLGSKVHAAYERYKAAQTVSEARTLEASRSMIKYDVEKGYAVLHDQPAVVVAALAAAPLVGAWCVEVTFNEELANRDLEVVDKIVEIQTCRVQNPDIPRAGRGRAAHGRAGRDVDGSARPGDICPSCPPGYRRQLSRTSLRKHEQSNPYLTDGGTKPAVDHRFIRGSQPVD